MGRGMLGEIVFALAQRLWLYWLQHRWVSVAKMTVEWATVNT